MVKWFLVLPYINPPSLKVGPFEISAFTVLVAFAMAAGQIIFWRRTQHYELDSHLAGVLAFWSFPSGCIGAHLWWMVSNSSEVSWAHVFSLRGAVSFGYILGIAAASVVILWKAHRPRNELRRWLDAGAYAFVFGDLIGRAGCALVHDHPGISSNSLLAVRFPDQPRFDLGLLEFLFMACFAPVVIFLDRRPLPPGGIFALVFGVYGGFRVLLDSIRISPATILSVSEDIWGGAALILLAIAITALPNKTVSVSR